MKTKILFLLFIIFSSSVFCQVSKQNTTSKFSKNTLTADGSLTYIAILGGFSSAINYERILSSGSTFTSYGKIGVGYSIYGDVGGGEWSGMQIPVSVSILKGMGKNHFEVNLGVRTIFNKDFDYGYFFYPIANLGYRYQPTSGGFLFKALAGTDGITLGVGLAF